MPTPLLHSFNGLVFFWANKKKPTAGNNLYPWGQLLVFLVLANLPDIDLVPRLFLGIPVQHGVFTHSLLFSFIVAILVGSWHKRRLSFALIAFLLVVSHLILDFFTGERLGFHPSWGIPWLYPFYKEHFTSPLTLFLGTKKRTLAHLFCWQNLVAVLYELCLVGLILALWWLLFRQVRPLTALLSRKPRKSQPSHEMK